MIWYVYQFIDPRNNSVFYVGKGSGNRIMAKRDHQPNLHLKRKLEQIQSLGLKERREIVKRFDDEQEALDHEAQLIQEYGLKNLCNILPGGTKAPVQSGPDSPNFKGDYLVGREFGELLVLQRLEEKTSRGHYLWLCRCNCGELKKTTSGKLKAGHTKSCGCSKWWRGRNSSRLKDLTGCRFGKLMVLEYVENRRRSTWKCRCDCGRIAEIKGYKMVSGHTKSCGCLRKKLSERDKRMIKMKIKEKEVTQTELSRIYNVSTSRIRQIVNS